MPATWREATHAALYGPAGFYRRAGGDGPAAHFRTSVHASPLFADAVLTLAVAVDEALGHPGVFDLVDVGAGRGELLSAVVAAAATRAPALAARLRPVAVELAAAPPGLSSDIDWQAGIPYAVTGLLIANEWLDDVPVDVVELTGTGPRVLLVDPVTGAESPGPEPAAGDRAWLDRWWPLRETGERAELGRPRDEAWADAVRRLRAGVALAVDYAVEPAVHRYGTLTGYRAGRQVRPVPDGSCDLTAHVHLDAVQAAGSLAASLAATLAATRAATRTVAGPSGAVDAAAGTPVAPGALTGATATVRTTQRAALRALGVDPGRPPRELASADPPAYLRALAARGEAAELTARGGLGDFGWLAHAVGLPAVPVLGADQPGSRREVARVRL